MDKKDAKLMEHLRQLEIDGKCMASGCGIYGKWLENGPRREDIAEKLAEKGGKRDGWKMSGELMESS